MRFYGNRKYIDQLEAYYNARNAAANARANYKKLSCQDKVVLAQQSYEQPSTCCIPIVVVWDFWEDFAWNLDSHAWGTDWIG